jgi:hypothetical protein
VPRSGLDDVEVSIATIDEVEGDNVEDKRFDGGLDFDSNFSFISIKVSFSE